MKPFDYDSHWNLYIRCTSDILGMLEEMYLTEKIHDSDMLDHLDRGIMAFQAAAMQVNDKFEENGYNRLPIFFIIHKMSEV